MPYIDFGVTPGVETQSVGSNGPPQPVDASFPFGKSLEFRVYVGFLHTVSCYFFLFIQVLNYGTFVFTPNITEMDEHTKSVSPFQSANGPSSGTIQYEVHKETSSHAILSRVKSIINQHENTYFSSRWLLVASWKDLQR